MYYFDRNDVRTTSIQYYSVLQSTTPVPYYKRTTKYYSSTTPYYKRTTKYYSSTTTSTPYYKRTTKYYSSTTPYYKRTTKYCSSTTPYYKVLLQYYSSTTPYYKVVQKLPKRAFRARFPQLFKEQASKTSVSCEASATFQATSFQNERFLRGFRNFSKQKLPK